MVVRGWLSQQSPTLLQASVPTFPNPWEAHTCEGWVLESIATQVASNKLSRRNHHPPLAVGGWLPVHRSQCNQHCPCTILGCAERFTYSVCFCMYHPRHSAQVPHFSKPVLQIMSTPFVSSYHLHCLLTHSHIQCLKKPFKCFEHFDCFINI